MRCYNHIDLWVFSTDPSYFGYNSTKLEICVLCILTFQGPSGTKIDRGFFGVNIFT
jgi:hypothetical protein